jgi:hypothetical protein
MSGFEPGKAERDRKKKIKECTVAYGTVSVKAGFLLSMERAALDWSLDILHGGL